VTDGQLCQVYVHHTLVCPT